MQEAVRSRVLKGREIQVHTAVPSRYIWLYYLALLWIVLLVSGLALLVGFHSGITGAILTALILGVPGSGLVLLARLSCLRIVADDEGVSGTRFLGRAVQIFWSDVEVVQEWSFRNARGRWVVMLALRDGGGKTITAADVMSNFGEFREVVECCVPAAQREGPPLYWRLIGARPVG